jgi:hypothetical protein
MPPSLQFVVSADSISRLEFSKEASLLNSLPPLLNVIEGEGLLGNL